MMMLISAMVLVTLCNMLRWAELNQFSTGKQSELYTSYVLPALQGVVAVFREAAVSQPKFVVHPDQLTRTRSIFVSQGTSWTSANKNADGSTKMQLNLTHVLLTAILFVLCSILQALAQLTDAVAATARKRKED